MALLRKKDILGCMSFFLNLLFWLSTLKSKNANIHLEVQYTIFKYTFQIHTKTN